MLNGDAQCAVVLYKSLHFSQCVARHYWRKRWDALYRFRAYGVENSAFSSGTSRFSWINCNHRQILIN